MGQNVLCCLSCVNVKNIENKLICYTTLNLKLRPVKDSKVKTDKNTKQKLYKMSLPSGSLSPYSPVHTGSCENEDTRVKKKNKRRS